MPDVNKVDIIGERPQKIFIEFSHAKLATLGITPQQIFDSVAKQNAVVSGGSVDTSADRINVRVTGAFSGAEAIAAVPVQADGRVFRLGDIATVKRGYEDPPSFIVREGGKPALGLGVSMAGRRQHHHARREPEDGDEGRSPPSCRSASRSPRSPTSPISSTIGIGIRPDLRRGARYRAGRELPVARLAHRHRRRAVGAARPRHRASRHVRAGLDLHRITLGALIIALGLLVDDAIIAIEMMVVKMEQGWDRVRAATFAWTSTAFPMLTGTLVTAAGFLPVGFAKSSSGEYAGGIFWVVGLALIASWIVAVVFTPYLGLKLLPDFAKHGAHDNPDAIYDTRIYRALRRVIELALRWRKTVVAATVVMFVAAIAGFGLVQQQFFPTSTRTELFFEMRLPEGTAIGVTDAAAKKAETPACRRSRHRHLHHLCRPGLAALLAWAQSGAAEPELRSDRHRHQGPRGARARQGAARKGACRRAPCRKRGPGSTASCSVRRSASRCSSAWSAPTR